MSAVQDCPKQARTPSVGNAAHKVAGMGAAI
jgi:hypothetical protein